MNATYKTLISRPRSDTFRAWFLKYLKDNNSYISTVARETGISSYILSRSLQKKNPQLPFPKDLYQFADKLGYDPDQMLEKFGYSEDLEHWKKTGEWLRQPLTKRLSLTKLSEAAASAGIIKNGSIVDNSSRVEPVLLGTPETADSKEVYNSETAETKAMETEAKETREVDLASILSSIGDVTESVTPSVSFNSSEDPQPGVHIFAKGGTEVRIHLEGPGPHDVYVQWA